MAPPERKGHSYIAAFLRTVAANHDAVDFIRNYSDRFHHAKEEDVLFIELIKNGMPEK